MPAKRIGRPPTGATKTKKSVTIDTGLLAAAEQAAARTKTSLSALVENALEKHLRALATAAARAVSAPAAPTTRATLTATASISTAPVLRPGPATRRPATIVPAAGPRVIPISPAPLGTTTAAGNNTTTDDNNNDDEEDPNEHRIIPIAAASGKILPITSRVAETADPAPQSPISHSQSPIHLRQAPHILAAAGAPISAEVLDWDGSGDTVLVKINGLSMTPLLNDGEVIAMKHRRSSRNPFMKKGLIYLCEYDGGYTVKRYNTRKPTPEETGEDWVENGKVKILQSLNPDFPEIIIKQPVEWVAWLEE